MKLKEFIENLNEFVKNNPECLEMNVCSSADDEGNRFNEIYYAPSKGNLNDRDFINAEQFEEYDDLTESDINAVCIN